MSPVPSSYSPHLPIKELHRRVVLILDRDQLERLQYDKKHRRYYQAIGKTPGISFIETSPIASMVKDNGIIGKLQKRGLLRSGNVLVQNSFDPSSYVVADEAVLELGEQKWNHYAHVCSLLGARCVEVKSLQVEQIRFRESLFVRWVSLFSLASAGRQKEQFQEIVKKRCDRREYPGLERPNIKAVEEYIKRNCLEDHEDIRDLKKSRTSPNPLQNHELTVDVSHHIESKLKLVESLYLPSYFTEINAQIEKTRKQMFQTKLEVTLQFVDIY